MSWTLWGKSVKAKKETVTISLEKFKTLRVNLALQRVALTISVEHSGSLHIFT